MARKRRQKTSELTESAADEPSRSWTAPPLLQPLVIIGANVVPVLGVFFFGWDVFTILFLFWLENVIVGFFNVWKMQLEPETVPHRSGGAASITFFIIHYGMFMLGHGVFVVMLSLKPESWDDLFVAIQARWLSLGAAFISLVVEHAADYVSFVRQQEYLTPGRVPQFLRPYGRLVIMHVTIVGGGFLAQELGSPRAALLTLIGLKIAFDLAAWVVELPGTGMLGRVKGAFGQAAVAAIFGFIISMLPLGFGGMVLGFIASGMSRMFGTSSMGSERWAFYGFGAAGVIALVAAVTAWWHHMLSAIEQYREAGNSARTVVLVAILALLVAAGAWPATAGYRSIMTQYRAAKQDRGQRQKQKAESQKWKDPTEMLEMRLA